MHGTRVPGSEPVRNPVPKIFQQVRTTLPSPQALHALSSVNMAWTRIYTCQVVDSFTAITPGSI